MTETSGRHFHCTYSGCDPENLHSASILEAVLRRTAALAANKVLDVRVASSEDGVEALLKLSHGFLSVRTHPAQMRAHVELFTTSDAKAAETALVRLNELLGAAHCLQKCENRSRPLRSETDSTI